MRQCNFVGAVKWSRSRTLHRMLPGVLFLFAGPVACIVATVLITALIYYRQLYSPTAIAIARYVEALKRIKP